MMTTSIPSTRVKDITGQVFGRLTVVGYHGQDKEWNAMWVCRCVCGEVIATRGMGLKSGRTKSCGCYQRECTIERSTKHGHCPKAKSSPEWASWQAMLQRCSCPTNQAYDKYGGRGIGVCERWKEFDAFLEDMGPRPTRQHTLDRIDNDGDYEPGNCRWATKKQQGRNRRNNRHLTANGETRTISEWSEMMGHRDRTLIYQRLKAGWSAEDAIFKPSRTSRSEVA